MRVSAILYPAAALAALAIAGCSSNDDVNGSVSCSVTFSGAATGTYNCGTVSAAYTTASATSAFAFFVSSPALTVAISIPGELAATNYTNNTSGANGGITLTSGSTTYYAVLNTGNTLGTFTLHLTSVSLLTTGASGKTYVVHGTLNGVLAPTSAGASVTMSSTF